jgi:hypothetical protein
MTPWAVGNRKQMTSSLPPVPAGLFNYDANDRFSAGDTYDNNGNTISSGGVANVYDFENHLIQKEGVNQGTQGFGRGDFVAFGFEPITKRGAGATGTCRAASLLVQGGYGVDARGAASGNVGR